MNKFLKVLLSIMMLTSVTACAKTLESKPVDNSSKKQEVKKETSINEETKKEEKEQKQDKKEEVKKEEKPTSTKKEQTPLNKKEEKVVEVKPEEVKHVVVNMNVASNEVRGSQWATCISNTTAKTPGQNQSPSLVFDEVTDAKYYSIYMIDTSAGNWVHWNANNLQKVSFNLGENPGKYKGPYPPSGTHTYQIHVFALKEAADKNPSAFDQKCSGASYIQKTLDVSNGQKGNVLGHGTIIAKVISGGEIIE